MASRNTTLLSAPSAFGVLRWRRGISSKFYLDILTLIFFTAYIGQSWNILGGYAGQFSFGGVMFFGTGAYASSILVTAFGVPAIIGLFVAILAGAVLAFCVGYLSFRSGLRGSYFALITLAFAELLRVVANSLEITGGGVGLFLTYAPGLQNLQFKTPVGFYYFALVLLAISIAIAIWLENSRFGAQLVAIRENEDAAEALGIDTLRRKCQAIMIMGAMGGAAGTFYSQKYLSGPPDCVQRAPVGRDAAGDDRRRDGNRFRAAHRLAGAAHRQRGHP